MKTTQAAIIELLGWSLDKYTGGQYQAGLEYLDHYLANDAWGKNLLEGSSFYWAWWKNQWDRRTGILLNDYQEGRIAFVNLEAEYISRHSIEELNIVPNRVVLENSYAKMIGNLIDAKP